jgi:phosphopantothenoylcysteine decarboxylase/phosphopantothenate--cysteine ligase
METECEVEHAKDKLQRKNFDFIVLNSLREAGAGFQGDTNVVTLIDKHSSEKLPLMPKREVAEKIVDKIETLLSR